MFVSSYFNRGIRWDKSPYQKASPQQWRAGWFFVACFPTMMLAFLSHTVQKPFNAYMNSVTLRQHSIIWLYLGFTLLIAFGLFLYVVVGPKVPLWLSVPVAIVGFAACLWCGWHL